MCREEDDVVTVDFDSGAITKAWLAAERIAAIITTAKHFMTNKWTDVNTIGSKQSSGENDRRGLQLSTKLKTQNAPRTSVILV